MKFLAKDPVVLLATLKKPTEVSINVGTRFLALRFPESEEVNSESTENLKVALEKSMGVG